MVCKYKSIFQYFLGPIYTYWVGETPLVAINDPKLAYQMFVKDADNYIDRGFRTF